MSHQGAPTVAPRCNTGMRNSREPLTLESESASDQAPRVVKPHDSRRSVVVFAQVSVSG